MPDQAPPPGLYQQLLTEGLEQQLRGLRETLVATGGLDPQEAPRVLARHLAGLARIALEHLSGDNTPEHQLALVNQLVGLLQSQAPRAISTADLLHPSARLLSEIRSTALLPGQTKTTRPLIPLADGTLLVNAASEPSVGVGAAGRDSLRRSDRPALCLHQVEWPAASPTRAQRLPASRW